MAHRPFWFQPEFNENDEVINLVPMIMRGRAPLPLTTSFVEQVNTLIADLIDKTANLAATIAKTSVGTAS